MKRFHITIIAIFNLLMIACSKDEKLTKPSSHIVGHWKMTSISVVGAAEDKSIANARESKLEVIFHSNGSCNITIWDKSGDVTDRVEGKYILEDNNLTIAGPHINNYKFIYSIDSELLTLNCHDGDAIIKLTLSKRVDGESKQDEQVEDGDAEEAV